MRRSRSGLTTWIACERVEAYLRVLRQSQGGIGSLSAHNPRRWNIALASAASYAARSCGVCSLAYRRNHQASPVSTWARLASPPSTRTLPTTRPYLSVFAHSTTTARPNVRSARLCLLRSPQGCAFSGASMPLSRTLCWVYHYFSPARDTEVGAGGGHEKPRHEPC